MGGETLIEFVLSVGKFAKFAMYELKGGELVVGKPQGTSWIGVFLCSPGLSLQLERFCGRHWLIILPIEFRIMLWGLS